MRCATSALLGIVLLSTGCPGATPAKRPTSLAAASKNKAPASPNLAKRDLPRAFVKRLGKPVSAALLAAIVREWFDRPYSYMFENARPVVRVFGVSYGRFLAGVDGIVLYGGLARAIAETRGYRSRGFYDMTPIAALSGLPIYTRKTTNMQTDFNRFNPAIIRWGAENLIPEPHGKIGRITYQALYSAVFSRCFRLFAESRIYLLGQRGRCKSEQAAYLTAMKRTNFDALVYLKKRYAQALPAYAISDNSSNFTPQMAIGFWLRRGIDGTDRTLWRALTKLLRRYDAVWWKTLRARAGRRAL